MQTVVVSTLHVRTARDGGYRNDRCRRDHDQLDLVEKWAGAAITYASVEPIEDPCGYFATVPGARGAWGFGETTAEAIAELEEVLVDWATLKLSNGRRGNALDRLICGVPDQTLG